MGSTKTILKRATAYALAFVMAFSMLFTGNNAVTANAAAAVTKITVKKKSVSIQPKKSVNVGVTVKGSNKKFTAKSSKKSVATVKVVGKKVRITAKKKGKATITVTTKGKNKKGKKLSAKIAVVVQTAEEAKKAAADQAAATAAQTTLNALPAATAVTPADEAKITEARNAYNALTDEQKALVPADVVKKLTDAEAALKAAKDAAAAQQAAAGAVTSVAFGSASYSVEKGKSVPTAVTVLPADAKDKTIKYTTSNSNVATVTDAGIVFGFAAGTATITATASNGVSGTTTVTVTEPIVITLSNTELTIGKNQTANITASVAGVEWSSDNEAVATVDTNGKVKGISEGSANIIAKSGAVTASCKVIVTKYAPENDGVTLSVFNPIKNNDDTVIDNTVLINQDMIIQAYVQKDSTPVKGARVTLELSDIDEYLCWPGQFATMVDGSEKDVAVTNDEGVAEFTVKYDGAIDSTYDNIGDCPYISFKATTLVDNQPIDEDKAITVKFASVLRNGIQVDNNDPNYDIPDIIPFVGHAGGDDGIQQSFNTNDYYPVEYVSSQQVGEGNDVYLSATPYFVLPPEQQETEAKFEVKFENGTSKVTTGQTDVKVEGPGQTQSYTIYNNGADLTTKTSVINVPEGLVSMAVFFDRISISKYSQLYIDLYELETGKHIYGKTYTEFDEIYTTEEGVSIKNVKDMKGKGVLIVSLQSPGQVDVSTTGYAMTRVTGDFNSEATKLPEMVEVVDAVEWSDVTSSAKYEVKETMTYTEVSKYLSEYVGKANTYLINDDNYTFYYRVPTFQSDSQKANAITGNALITATYKPPTGDPKTATFAYPCIREREWDSVNSKWIYKNANVLMDKSPSIKAIFLGNDVVDSTGNVQQITGGMTDLGNQAKVMPSSSNKSGAIFVEAKIKVNALEKEIKGAGKNYEKNPLKGANEKYPLYSYVQFVAKPEEGEADGVVPTFHAIEDQYIVVTGQVIAGNNEDQTNQTVEFYYGGTKITPAMVGTVIGNEVKVSYLDTTTDSYGKAYLVLIGHEGSYVNNIRAEYEGTFKTFKTFAGDQEFVKIKQGDEQNNICNLCWLDLGLAYQKDVRVPSWIYNYPETTENTYSESVVEKQWKVGFLPIAECPLGDFVADFDTLAAAERDPSIVPANVFVGITGVNVEYDIDGENKTNCSVQNDNSVLITSPKTGKTSVWGTLAFDKDAEGNDVEQVAISYYDGDGVLHDGADALKTVGVNSVKFNNTDLAKNIKLGGDIIYNMTWTPSNWSGEYIYPYGTSVYKDQNTTLYYKLHDKNNNPIVDTDVTVTAQFNKANYTAFTYTAKTDANGLVTITVPAPGTTGDMIFTVEIAGVMEAVSTTINYNDVEAGTEAFKMVSATFDKDNNKQITIKFNNKIARNVLTEEMLLKMFTITDNKTGELMSIGSVTTGFDNVTITLKDNETKTFVEKQNYTVQIMTGIGSNKCEIDGITYVLYDVNGQAVLTANQTKTFTVAY